jgi:hypothetical protein
LHTSREEICDDSTGVSFITILHSSKFGKGRTMSRSLRPLTLLPMLLLAACQPAAEEASAPAPTQADLATTPPSTASPATPSDLPLKQPSATDVPVPGSVEPPADTVGANGFGAVRFGMDRDDAENAAGGALEGPAADSNACYVAHRPGQPEIAYMFDDGKLARIDVHTPGVLADGGGRVGMQVDEIRTLYAGHLSEQPAKSDPSARLLKIGGDKPGVGGVIFDVDGTGRVTRYRAGLPPALDSGEGCS